MKKLLFQFDTDTHASSFDTVVAYDGGADSVMTYAGLTTDNISALVAGTIFTRPPHYKKNTAIFIGGSDVEAGCVLLQAIQRQFFAGFQVSVMLDSNGCNTTSSAAVAKIATNTMLANKKVVILAGTGAVGSRAAALFALEGADVTIASRRLENAKNTCIAIKNRFNVALTAVATRDDNERADAIKDAHIVLATATSGVELLKPKHWQNNPNLEVIADMSATPPLGIGGINALDTGTVRYGKKIWGALGIGSLKLSLHKACIAKLFTNNKQVLDAELIFKLAKEMA